jgi:hypothetical protein
MGELILGSPMFKGENAHDQLVNIIKKIGSPSENEIKEMNPDYKELKFPSLKA